MAMMNVKEWEKKLRAEGFAHFFTRQDGPKAFYPEHTHALRTTHVILDGEMALTLEGRTRTVKSGERLDVPANTVHSARMGPAGCRYLVGEEENPAR
jgi:mannose-6-phosphate isomerase-like protein (cupin superfamily)